MPGDDKIISKGTGAGIIGMALLGVVGVSIVLLRAWPMINVVETGHTPEYPDVQPHVYRAPVSSVFDAALHTIQRLPRWSLVSYSEAEGDIRAEARTRILRFVDDIRIRIAERGQGTSVDIRSASRVGRGDFGQNARNIRALLNGIDKQMGGGAAHE